MDTYDYIPKLVRASLDHDDRAIRMISTTVMRKIKIINPEVASEIGKALDYNAIGSSALRGVGISSSPIDNENRSELLRVEEPLKIDKPIFDRNTNLFISEFIEEREKSEKLLKEGLFPTSSLLFYGPPGVGKTYLAKYLAGELNLKFATLNLSASISSYLGRTGKNLKSILDYAKEEPTLLLLDEFDSIAKTRDDNTELGELKRIVNVLLKELEEWPHQSVIIAATNFPELLDKAIWRRFDMSLKINLPSKEQRLQLLNEKLINANNIDENTINTIVQITDSMSADDMCKIVERARKSSILKDEDIVKALLKSVINQKGNDDIKLNKKICIELKNECNLSISKIADIIGKSKSTVQYYLKKMEG
ncbi:MAG TPA: AAA family ATPase [Clostridium sp.]|uniref:AAA family ATPase n=1 Tax=Clostridium sp. TaxID=1506 RepID=UPI002F95BF40